MLNPKADVLNAIVAADGTVSSKGKLTSSTEQAIVVIAFEDSSNKTLPVQGRCYQLVLRYIQLKNL